MGIKVAAKRRQRGLGSCYEHAHITTRNIAARGVAYPETICQKSPQKASFGKKTIYTSAQPVTRFGRCCEVRVDPELKQRSNAVEVGKYGYVRYVAADNEHAHVNNAQAARPNALLLSASTAARKSPLMHAEGVGGEGVEGGDGSEGKGEGQYEIR